MKKKSCSAVLIAFLLSLVINIAPQSVPVASAATMCNPNPPVANWMFDEGSGADAFDSTTHDNHGLLQRGATWGMHDMDMH